MNSRIGTVCRMKPRAAAPRRCTPSIKKKITNEYHPPDHCERYCKCTNLFDCNLTSK